MKKFLIAAVAFVALAGPALAADMAPAPYTKAPAVIPPPVYSWTGWYVGVNGGYIDRNGANVYGTPVANDGSTGAATPYAGLIAAAVTNNVGRSSGGLGGGQVGYNWEINKAVFGFEADIDGVSAKSSTTVNALIPAPGFPAFPLASNFSASQNLNYIGTVRGRIGFLAGSMDALLLYATGGLAYGGVSSSVGETYTITPAGACLACTTGTALINSSSTRVGWTVGGGAEWKFSPNWSVKAEGLYYDLTSYSTNGTLFNINTATGLPYVTTNVNVNNRTAGAIARVGLNYEFGGPVVARY
jgi:outer membrane immunogenic protein